MAKATKSTTKPRKTATGRNTAPATSGPEGVKDPAEAARLAASAAAARAAEEQASFSDPEGEDDGDTVNLEMAKLKITRDNTTTFIEAFAHEVPIYEALHGEDAVEHYDSYQVEVADFDAQTEHDRLIRKFGKNGKPEVLRLYPHVRVLAQTAGVDSKLDSKRNKSSEQALVADMSRPGAETQGRIKTARVVRKVSGKR